MVDEPVSLREHLELKARVDVIDTRAVNAASALELQAKNYEQHLASLNNEQARLAADRERFLPRETFSLFEDSLREWRDSINRFSAASAGRDSGIGTSWSIVLAVFGLSLAGGCGGLSLLVSVVQYLVNGR